MGKWAYIQSWIYLKILYFTSIIVKLMIQENITMDQLSGIII